MRYLKILIIAILCSSCTQSKDIGLVQVLELDIPKNTIPEGIAIHPKTGEIFISSIHLNTITKSESSGKNSIVFLPKDFCGYSAGVGMEIFKDKLYALGSFDRKKQSVLVIKDLADHDNKSIRCFSLPDGVKSYFNDLAIDNLGNAYMTDTDSHKIYFYNTTTNIIDVFITDEQIQHPNGIAISSDNSKLFIDSYSHGIRIVDVKTKKILNKPHTESTKIGIDGLKYYNGKLFAVRNGGKDTAKHGLYEFTLNKNQDKIDEGKQLLTNHKKMDIPTTLAIHKGDAYILANSQLLNLDQDKNEIKDVAKLQPTYVLKVRLN